MFLYSEVACEFKKGKVTATQAAANVGLRMAQVVKQYIEREHGAESPKAKQSLTALATLEAYGKALEADEFRLRFDSLSASIRFNKLLADLRDICKEQSDQAYDRQLFPKDTELGEFLGAIFSMPYDTFPDDPAWKKVREYLTTYIEKFGDLHSKKAYARCRFELPPLVEKTAAVVVDPSNANTVPDNDKAGSIISNDKQARRKKVFETLY
jgi:hypothetical protein